MLKAAKILAVLAAIECFGIMALEMFFWQQAGIKINPNMTADFLSQTVTMAANQGLYNGFLGLGIIFGMIRKNEVHCALDRIKTWNNIKVININSYIIADVRVVLELCMSMRESGLK